MAAVSLVSTVGVLLAIGVAVLPRLERDVEEQAQLLQSTVLVQLAESLERIEAVARSDLRKSASLLARAGTNMDDDLHGFLETLSTEVAVYDASSTLVDVAGVPGQREEFPWPAKLEHKDGVASAASLDGGLLLVAPVFSSLGDRPTWVVATPWPRGAVREALSAARLRSLPDGAVAFLVEGDGDTDVALLVDGPRRAVPSAGLRPAAGVTMSAVVRFGGEDMLVSELGLAPVDGRGRWLRVATPAHVYLDPARGTLRRAIEIGLAVGLLLLLAALVLGYRLAAPIRLLANSVRGILQGAPSGPSASRAQRRRDEIGTLARALTKAGAELRAAEVDARATALLRRDLGRFLSPGVADVVARGEQSLSLASQRCVVTVMFVDVVGFTRIAETLGPEDGVILLNEVFSISTEAVFSQGGAVDKFVGDAVMAVFGGPYARSENHAGAALRAASITHRLIETASMGWRVRWGLEVEVAIGVHTGEAILGTVGGSARLDHTVVGEPANVAARLEALARPGRTLTSLETARAAGWPASRLSSVGSSRIPGRAIPLPLVEVGP